MATILPKSKITPPLLPNIVERSRLIERLNANKDKRMVLILGQAAQGKSVLAASFIKASNDLSAWVNLHEEDSNPVNFFLSIVCSIQNALKDVDLSSLLSYPAMSMGPRSEIPLYREWVNAISQSVLEPVQVVLDGMDRLDFAAPSLSFFKVLVEELPRHIHLIVLSRKEPPIELQNLKMRQEIEVLSNEDLAFNLEEVRELYKGSRGLNLGSTSLKRIERLTEGWVGGLILLAETIQKMPEEARDKYIAVDMPDRFKADLFRYFGETVFASQPASIKDFLVKSSILDPVEPRFMEDLIGIENPEAVLQDLVRQNLFVLPLFEEGKGWTFRYHQLFRDFLKTKLQQTVSENDRRSLILKAASLHEERGELHQSVSCYLEARSYSSAARVIEQIGMELLKQGRTIELGELLKSIPEDLIQKSPWLLFCFAMTNRFTKAGESIQNLGKAFSLFSEQENIAGQLLSLALLIEGSVMRGHDDIPLSSLLEKAEQILDRTIPDHYLFEKAMLLNHMAFGLTIRGGNPRKSLWACDKAYLISRQLNDFRLQMHALVNALSALSWLGEFSLADKKREELENLVEKQASPSIQTFYLTALCESRLFRGDLEETEKQVQQAKSQVEKHGLIYLYPMILIYELMLKPDLEQYREAEAIGKRLLSFASSIGNPFVTGIALLYLGRNEYYQGEWEKAKELIEQSHGILSSAESLSLSHLRVINLLDALISCHLGRGGSALKQLLEILDYCTTALHPLLEALTHFAAALIYENQARFEDAIAHLRAGFKISQEKGYTFFPMLSRPDVLRVCVLALELEIEDVLEYAMHLISSHLGSLAQPELKRLSLHPSHKIREKAAEIGLAIHRSKVPPLRISTLGEFIVTRGDSIVVEKEWQGSQPKNLLKAIVSHGEQGVHKEVLIDELWPESKPNAAEQTFKAALHRLRRSLETDLDKAYGSSYLYLEDNRVCLDSDLCKVDVYKFVKLLEEGRAKEAGNDLKGALSCYVEALKLYKGDFLPDDLYTEWAESKRWELKNNYLVTLMKAAHLHEQRGAYKQASNFYRRAIEADPVKESAYQKLMHIFIQQGKRKEALTVYEECKKALKKELDMEPAELTLSLYRKIAE